MLQLSTTNARYLRRFIQTYRCFIIVDLGGGRRWLPLFSFGLQKFLKKNLTNVFLFGKCDLTLHQQLKKTTWI